LEFAVSVKAKFWLGSPNWLKKVCEFEVASEESELLAALGRREKEDTIVVSAKGQQDIEMAIR
jgi:hypothetical protein